MFQQEWTLLNHMRIFKKAHEIHEKTQKNTFVIFLLYWGIVVAEDLILD